MRKLIIALLLVLGLLVAGILIIFLLGALAPTSHQASVSVELNHPPEAVWAIISDPQSASAWRAEIESVQPIPAQDGRPCFEERNEYGLFRYCLDVSGAPTRMVSTIVDHADFGGTWTFDLEPSASGTKLTITENGEVYNTLARFFAHYVIGYEMSLNSYVTQLPQAPFPVVEAAAERM